MPSLYRPSLVSDDQTMPGPVTVANACGYLPAVYPALSSKRKYTLLLMNASDAWSDTSMTTSCRWNQCDSFQAPTMTTSLFGVELVPRLVGMLAETPIGSPKSEAAGLTVPSETEVTPLSSGAAFGARKVPVRLKR